MKPLYIVLAVVAVLALLVFGSYNSLITKDQAVTAKWAQVETDYQRRSDLIPNLVAVVKGAANFEQSTLTKVVEARAAATGIRLSASELTPENIAKFDSAQTGLSGALSRLLVVAEAYPVLTATETFKQLQGQLEGTENRIGVSRKDFNNAVQDYNVAIKTFPGVLTAMILGFKEKAFFKAAEGSEVAPKVEL